ncbi:MAG: hypothetical protein LBF15_02890 [Candidatus Peribacteria bacterium]|nr:hypothetical protein [Candidatus Peribacteria bacterium]
MSIVDRNLDIVNSLDEKVLLEVEINKVDKITDTRIVYIGKTVSPLLPTGEGLGVRLEI